MVERGCVVSGRALGFGLRLRVSLLRRALRRGRVYDAVAAEKAWGELLALFKAALG
jgi:dienelactone hydrolase